MKKLLLASLLLVSSIMFAQAPQGISYQAVAFSSSGSPVANGNVGIKISILDNSVTGTVVYAEIHNKPTNAQGLFNLNIGQGTAVTGTFAAISWGTNNKFLKVEIDPAGGTTYSITGTNQLMSVPYALYAQNINPAGLAGIGTSVFKKSNFAVADDNKVQVFSNGTWYTKTCSDFISSDQIKGTNGNFAIMDDNSVHVFSNGTWSTKTCSSYVNPEEVITSEGNFAVADDNAVHVFSNGTWTTKNCSSFVNPEEIIASEGNFAVADDNNVHAFSNGVWLTKVCASYVNSEEIIASGGSFVVADDNNAHAFYNGVWVTKVCSDYINSDEVIISTTD